MKPTRGMRRCERSRYQSAHRRTDKYRARERSASMRSKGKIGLCLVIIQLTTCMTNLNELANAKAAANAGFGVTENVPGETQSRGEVLAVWPIRTGRSALVAGKEKSQGAGPE